MSNELKKYSCTYKDCNSSYNRPYRLQQHLLTHNNVKAFACPENNCNKSYSNKSHLDRHINSVHCAPDAHIIYSCPTCLKTYANRQNLKRHIKLGHLLQKPFSCDVCKLQFKKKNQLRAHMFKHTGIKSFSCELCSTEFVSLYEKKKHMRWHKIFECEECQIKFNVWSKFVKHRQMHIDQKEFICNDCGRSFKKRIHIVRHLKTHSNINKFTCPYENCQRNYSRNSNLKQHILMKHVKVPHECHICNAQLSTKAKLTHHLKLHSQGGIKMKPPKTKLTGRKERKDKGRMKTSTALKLAGIIDIKEVLPDNDQDQEGALMKPCIS